VKVELCVRGGDHTQQAGIESDELVYGGADDVGYEAEVGGVVDGYGVSEDRRV